MASVGSSALEGLRVLEISAAGNWAASLLGMLLADQGASVAKLGVHPDHAPIENAAARTRSREARSRAGIDRNKRVLQPIDADSIHAIRPEAIYCTISAYPRGDWPGYDPLLQIGSGIDGGWQYTNPEPQGGCESTPVPLVTLRSLRLQATPVTDTQVGKPCPRELDAVTVIAQKQPDGSSNYFPAPSHVRFEEADDPIILPAAVLESSV